MRETAEDFDENRQKRKYSVSMKLLMLLSGCTADRVDSDNSDAVSFGKAYFVAIITTKNKPSI